MVQTPYVELISGPFRVCKVYNSQTSRKCVGNRWEAESWEAGNGHVQILWEVEKFLRSRGVAPTRFGREVVRDPRFVFDLRRGREPRRRTVERVRAFLEAAQ